MCTRDVFGVQLLLLVQKSISEEGTPQQFPDFTRGMWKTTSPLDIIL